MNAKRVVLIGAARSGTKIVRDVLAEALSVGCVPYDIGYVWRYGNNDIDHDVIAPEKIPARNRDFMRSFIDRYAAGSPTVVVEKTVGNTLRVPAVHHVLPGALFVHLIRDGVDVAESTRRQWGASTDWRYTVKKLRHFPIRMIPGYGIQYAKSLAHRVTSDEKRVGSWGPRYPGIDDDLRTEDLLTVCCRQWQHSVVTATTDFKQLGIDPVSVRYEDLVADPAREIAKISAALDMQADAGALATAASRVRATTKGRGRQSLSGPELQLVDREIGESLARFGYQPAVGQED